MRLIVTTILMLGSAFGANYAYAGTILGCSPSIHSFNKIIIFDADSPNARMEIALEDETGAPNDIQFDIVSREKTGSCSVCYTTIIERSIHQRWTKMVVEPSTTGIPGVYRMSSFFKTSPEGRWYPYAPDTCFDPKMVFENEQNRRI